MSDHYLSLHITPWHATPHAAPRPILVVDDDPDIRALVAAFLHDAGYEVLVAAHGAAAIDILAQQPPALVILDMRMPGPTGCDVMSMMRARGLEAPVVVMTGSPHGPRWAHENDAAGCLRKPFDGSDLLSMVQQLCGPPVGPA